MKEKEISSGDSISLSDEEYNEKPRPPSNFQINIDFLDKKAEPKSAMILGKKKPL